MTTTTKESKAKKSKLDRLPEDMQKFLCDGIAEAMKDWGGFLRMSQKFTTYSFNNTMLIWIQQLSRELEPSSQVAGYKAWQTKFKRQVKKGAKCIRILAPRPVNKMGEDGKPILNKDGKPIINFMMFRAVKVFDYRETEGEPLPERPDTSHVMKNIEGDAMPGLLEGLCKVAEARNVEIIRNVPEAEMGGAHGECWFTGENGTASKIKLKEGLSILSEIHTLAHELGHSILHNRDEYEKHKSTSIKELEAESVAMLVCNSYDIETCKCSFDYIMGHNTKNKDVQESMLNAGDRIYKAHKEITTIVDKHLKEVSK
jgi:hypothetical protein